MTLTLEWNSRDIEIWKGPVRSAVARALKKAGGDAIRAMRVESSRTIRERKRFKVRTVNTALVLDFPRGNNIDQLEWKMRVRGQIVPVVDFPHRQIGSRIIGRKGRKERASGGVRVEINRGRPVLIRSAFVATMRSGHTGVFLRKGAARLPIRELFTTRVSDVFGDTGMVPNVQARTQDVFKSAFARLLPLELAKVQR